MRAEECDVSAVTDAAIDSILNHCTQLHTLDFSNWHMVRNKTVMHEPQNSS